MPHHCITQEVKNALGDLSKCESVSLRVSKLLNVPFDKEGGAKSEEVLAIIQCFRRKDKNGKPVAFKVPAPLIPAKGETFAMELKSRLIINQAGGVLENVGICLHRNFSYPYIPGSALKGVARHYAWELWNTESDSEHKLELAENIAETFGFPTGDSKNLDAFLAQQNPKKYADPDKPHVNSGSVAFLDGIPLSENNLDLDTDICTCHHPNYYNPKKNISHALDNEEPNPQSFPVLAPGAQFCFRLVPLKPYAKIAFAREMLQQALSINGIGGKTAAGYGWFAESESATQNVEKLTKVSACENPELCQKIWAKTNNELKSFLEGTLSPEEKSAVKVAESGLKGGQRDTLKKILKKGKGPAYKNLIEIFGEEEAKNRFA